jgi:hypothetical protein
MAWRLVVNVSHAILFGLLSYIVGGFPFLLNSISRTGHINQYQQVREVERFAQPVFAQPHPIDFPTRDLRQDWMRGTGIGLFGVVVLSAVFFDSTSSWCSVPMFVIHSMHAGFLLVSRPFFLADYRAASAGLGQRTWPTCNTAID